MTGEQTATAQPMRPNPAGAKPPWLRVRLPGGTGYRRLESLMRESDLRTVCEEAHCPNIGECWNRGTATFMILGAVCTRACGYCQVTSGRPQGLDRDEPRRVALAVQRMGLRHAVITSVNRDDLSDGGAEIFAHTIRWIRRISPDTSIEVLIPDFEGNWSALAAVLTMRPDVLNHNTETVPRLYPRARHKGRYERTLDLLQRAAAWRPRPVTKSGLMVGLGETRDEIRDVLRDLRGVDCDVLTVGQYLRPSSKHLPVDRYVPPEEFDAIAREARTLGFRHVEAGPLVRSSYHAESQVPGRGPQAPSVLIPLVDRS